MPTEMPDLMPGDPNRFQLLFVNLGLQVFDLFLNFLVSLLSVGLSQIFSDLAGIFQPAM